MARGDWGSTHRRLAASSLLARTRPHSRRRGSSIIRTTGPRCTPRRQLLDGYSFLLVLLGKPRGRPPLRKRFRSVIPPIFPPALAIRSGSSVVDKHDGLSFGFPRSYLVLEPFGRFVETTRSHPFQDGRILIAGGRADGQDGQVWQGSVRGSCWGAARFLSRIGR